MEKDQVVALLNQILEHELAGVVKYGHYSLMVFGPNRIPICSWLRSQATESLNHAYEVGELITSWEGHPSLKIGELLETHKHSIKDILEESLHHENKQIDLYKALLKQVENQSVHLEEFARKMIYEEELHVSEVRKMLVGLK